MRSLKAIEEIAKKLRNDYRENWPDESPVALLADLVRDLAAGLRQGGGAAWPVSDDTDEKHFRAGTDL